MLKAIPQVPTMSARVFADVPQSHIRRWDDILAAGLSLIAASVVWVIAVLFAPASAVDEVSVRPASSIMQSLVLLPVAAGEGAALLFVPIIVVGALLMRRDFMSVVYSLLSGASAVVFAVVVNSIFGFLPAYVSAPLAAGVQGGATFDPGNTYVVHGALVSLGAFLTVAGVATAKRSIRWSWALVFLVALSWALRSYISLPAAVISVLLGRSVGMVTRWFVGVAQRRVDAESIFRAASCVGVSVDSAIRVGVAAEELEWFTWVDGRMVGAGEDKSAVAFGVAAQALKAPLVSLIAPQVFILSGGDGVYAMYVFDPSERLLGTVREVWQAIRLRGLSRWIAPSMKASVERALLAAMSAQSVGVVGESSVGIVEIGEQYALVTQLMEPDFVPVQEAGVTYAEAAWEALALLHGRGIAHRNLSAESVHCLSGGTVCFSHWEYAEVGASELSCHIDCVQLLVVLASGTLGVRGAVECARRVLGEAGVGVLAPLVQRAVIPSASVVRLPSRSFLRELRDELAGVVEAGESDSLPLGGVNVQRFSVKSVATWALMFAALVMVTGMLNVRELIISMSQAHGWWLLGAFLLATLTWVGAGVTLTAFVPSRVSVWGAIGAQVAASLVTVVAPAGTGPASVNIRYLVRSRVSPGMAVVIVAVQQIFQLFFMLMILGVMVALTGMSVSVELPRPLVRALMFVGVGCVIAAVVVVAIPTWRYRVGRRLLSVWNRLIPRVRWVVLQPKRVFAIVAGNAVMNVGFIGAFWACTQALDVHLTFSALVVVYLTANSLGSVIPAPGGIGAVEAALTAGLQVAGVPLALALPVALAYRLVTFYGRVPFGWLVLRAMQSRGAL